MDLIRGVGVLTGNRSQNQQQLNVSNKRCTKKTVIRILSFTFHMFKNTSVNVPDVATKDISDGCADKVSLTSDGSLVSGANLLPLILAAFFLLISNVFLHTRLRLWSVGRGGFCSGKERKTPVRIKHFEVK